MSSSTRKLASPLPASVSVPPVASSSTASQPQPQQQSQPILEQPPTTSNNVSHPLEIQNTGEVKKGEITPPVPMVHLRALVISGDSHVFTFEPETTVGRMKELIWSMWPSGWTSPAQPPSPSFLRILHAGRILSDDSTLASNNLPAALAPTTPTTIHISVRSFSIRAEEVDVKKSTNKAETVGSRGRGVGNGVGGRGGGQDEVRSGCGCVVM